MKKLVLTSLLSTFIFLGYSQNGNFDLEAYMDVPAPMTIKKTNEKINADGVLDEASWSTADGIENFWQQFPFDTSRAEGQTQIMMIYDVN